MEDYLVKQTGGSEKPAFLSQSERFAFHKNILATTQLGFFFAWASLSSFAKQFESQVRTRLSSLLLLIRGRFKFAQSSTFCSGYTLDRASGFTAELGPAGWSRASTSLNLWCQNLNNAENLQQMVGAGEAINRNTVQADGVKIAHELRIIEFQLGLSIYSQTQQEVNNEETEAEKYLFLSLHRPKIRNVDHLFRAPRRRKANKVTGALQATSLTLWTTARSPNN
ncbi:hypothetical protein ACJ73_02756 [Blastomyces percursus]|uniref:Uncharacterized protein n=1 Tax=Blastomyces percursus TaxID=1658174 RepID=A0A1J9RDX7_9EURO|nr:hypothetical protein ACJ73_02756 [Blastomyces percursus]